MGKQSTSIFGVDLFCGAGGLTFGLQRAGIRIEAGVDLDPACEYPYLENNGSLFIEADVRKVTASEVAMLYPRGAIRLLAGCAPCRPFSPFRRGMDNESSKDWGLVNEFSRLVRGVLPELVTMENVPGLASSAMFQDFVRSLRRLRYHVAWKSLHCATLGLPQQRRRLVLIASRLGPVSVPKGQLDASGFRSVRSAIGDLPRLAAGEADASDPLHRARSVSPMNLRRLRASKPGGNWCDWPDELRAPCHTRESGASFKGVYSRMTWEAPSPTITTQAYSFGSGRFGHPDQDRSITLREAAILQSFPVDYRFVNPTEDVKFSTVGRLIGNAVPPLLAEHIGRELIRSVGAGGAG